MSERFQEIDRYLHEHVDGWMAELSELCAVPSVSARHEGIDECAALVTELLRRRGFDARVEPSTGHPVVLGHAGADHVANVTFGAKSGDPRRYFSSNNL